MALQNKEFEKKSIPKKGTDSYLIIIPQPPCFLKNKYEYNALSYAVSVTGNPREDLMDIGCFLSVFLLRDDFQNNAPTAFHHQQLSVGESSAPTLSLHRIIIIECNLFFAYCDFTLFFHKRQPLFHRIRQDIARACNYLINQSILISKVNTGQKRGEYTC